MRKMFQLLLFIALCFPSALAFAKPKVKKKPNPTGVVIPMSAKLYASKNAKKPFIEAKGIEGYVTVDLIKDDGKWLHVGHRGWVNGSCYDTLSASGIDFDFWVKKSAVAKVTTSEVTVKLKGGTSARIAPGVVIKKGKIHLDRGKLLLTAKVSSKKTGTSFVGKYFRYPNKTFAYEISKKGMLIGGQRYKSYDHEIIRESVVETKKKGRIKAKTPISCAELHGFFDDVNVRQQNQQQLLGALGNLSGNALSNIQGVGGLGLSGVGKMKSKKSKIYKAPVGTEVFWPNGDRAGQVAGYFSMVDPPEGKNNVCKKIKPFYTKKKKRPSFELCVPTKSLVEVKNYQGFGAVGKGYGGSGKGLLGSLKSSSNQGPKEKVKVTFSNVSVAGKISKDDVLFRVEKSVGAFRHCQILALKDGGPYTGKFTTSATIASNGRTTVKRKKTGGKTQSCVDDVMQKLKFKVSDGKTDATFTVNFAPR